MTDEHKWTATNELRYAKVKREDSLNGQMYVRYETVLQQKWNRCESLEEYENRMADPANISPVISEWRDVPNAGVVND